MSAPRVRLAEMSPEQRAAAKGSPVATVRAIKGHKQGGPSRVEARYAAHLEALKAAGEVLEFKPQPAPIELAHRCVYVPDFLVWFTDAAEGLEYVEVKDRKGKRPWFRDDGARVKVRVAARVLAARQCPARLVVVWPRKGGGWCSEVVKP